MRYSFSLLALVLFFPGPAQGGAKKTDVGKSYNVPYKLTDTGHVLVRTKINGKGPYNFIIDTGAPILIVNVKVGKELNLAEDKTGWATVERFEIEGGVVNSRFKAKVLTPFQLEGMNAMNFAGAELHGIIGYTLLAQYRLEFDFSDDKMKWTKLDFTPPEPQAVKAKGGETDGLNAMASIMKVMSFLMGKKENPTLVRQGFLGVEVAEKDGKIWIAAVLPQSPAAKMGLKKGDQVVRLGNKDVSDLDEVTRAAANLKEGDTLALTIHRDAKEIQVSVTAGKGL
jgi:hypothetical protein